MIYQTIGKNIKQLRQERGMTQSELADHLFVSPQMVSRYENNSAAPAVAMLARISSVFQVSLDVLCGLDNTAKDRCINYLMEKYSDMRYDSFAVLNETYENFLIEASEVLLDDRIMKLQLLLLINLHDNIENNKQHREINEKIFECTSRILDISRDDELRSLANYRMALYYYETPFDSAEYHKNLALSKNYLRNVLLCTYFPEYQSTVGTDIRSDEYIDAQINHIKFFAGKLHKAIKQLRRSNSNPELNIKYDELFFCLTEMLNNHNT